MVQNRMYVRTDERESKSFNTIDLRVDAKYTLGCNAALTVIANDTSSDTVM